MAFSLISTDASNQDYQQTALLKFGTALYQITTDPATPGGVRIFKSTDRGRTWTQKAFVSAHQGLGGAVGFIGVQLVGTIIYVVYPDPASGASPPFGVLMKSYDVSTDTLATVVVSGSPTTKGNLGLYGTAATSLYCVSDTNYTAIASGPFVLGQFVSGAYTQLATKSDGAHPFFNLDCGILGASGIIHLISAGANGGSSPGSTVDLSYLPVSAGAFGSFQQIVTNVSTNGTFNTFGYCGRMIQVGSTILFSFYNVTTQELMLCSFPDAAGPAFTFSVIDPSWAIQSPTMGGSGFGIAALQNLGGTLYCFYVNSNGSNSGDGNLYYRTSTNLGVTWSAIQTLYNFVDPTSHTMQGIWSPETVVPISGATIIPQAEITVAENGLAAPNPEGRFIQIPGLSASCPAGTGTVGVPYDSFVTVSGIPPFVFFLNTGSLPPGLSLNATTGEITGTPTQTGTFPFSLQIDDEDGGRFVIINCSIMIEGADLTLSFKGLKVYPQ